MNEHVIRLGELAFVCYVFDQTDRREYEAFLQETDGYADLYNSNHRNALLRFLNRWGCRHIARAHHEQASQEIEHWYGNHGDNIPNGDLWEVTEQDLYLIGQAFDDLFQRNATPERRFGATAAAKSLFAIRPRTLVPWDNGIRRHYVGANGAYCEFISLMRDIVLNLNNQCQHHNFGAAELPERLGTPNKTVPKLIDEYNWMNITNGFRTPDRQTFQRWVEWSE